VGVLEIMPMGLLDHLVLLNQIVAEALAEVALADVLEAAVAQEEMALMV
jgi:hypothetical protein